jgi:hypothetical protein
MNHEVIEGAEELCRTLRAVEQLLSPASICVLAHLTPGPGNLWH